MGMTKVKKLTPGMTIGVVSPSSGLWKRSELWLGIEGLEKQGFKVKVGQHAYRNHFYLAGTDEERAADLMEAFTDPAIDAVFCSQGGYGTARLYRHLDFDRIRAHPKLFIGYSDITSLHLAIQCHCGFVTFHGPGATGFDPSYMCPYTLEYFLKATSETEPVGLIAQSGADRPLLKVTGGIAEAPIVGGNLTLLCASLGTPFEVDTKDKLFFIEELDTEPWIMDHMLTHLLNAGKFADAAGIVVGECTDCEPFRHHPGFYNQCSFEDVIFDRLAPLGKPLVYGIQCGHAKEKITIPLGVNARLDATAGQLEILESGVE
jgi:muramoyltetrapeptide carboxypeptidase